MPTVKITPEIGRSAGYRDRTSIPTDAETLAEILDLPVEKVLDPISAASDAIETFRHSVAEGSQLVTLHELAILADLLQTALRSMGPGSSRGLQLEYKNWPTWHFRHRAQREELDGAEWARVVEEEGLKALGASADEVAEKRHRVRAEALLQEDLRAVDRLSANLSTAAKAAPSPRRGAPGKALADFAAMRLIDAYETIAGEKFMNSRRSSSKGRARRFVVRAFELWDIGDQSEADGAISRVERRRAQTLK